MKCPTGKVGYRKWLDAEIARSRKDSFYERAYRVYRCPSCKQYHLTTKRAKRTTT